jgi:LmbE family N-acetylglucosaminyl deacetylase
MVRGWGVAFGVAFLEVVACGGSRAAPPSSPTSAAPSGAVAPSNENVVAQAAAEALAKPCGPTSSVAPVPRGAASRPASDFGEDVVFFLAHPEDETLFTPGTMAALVQAKRKVYGVVMSHGEGGRLLDVNAEGDIHEATGSSPAEVAQVRDRELAHVMEVLGVRYEHLYPASAGADFAAKDVQGHARAVHACDETLARWNEVLPGGLGGALQKLVAMVRTHRPRVVVTHDARDDDDWLDHGHHKAFGALVDLATRLAADPRVPGGRPHAIEEMTTIAPKQVKADLTLHVGNDVRKKVMTKHLSQFDPKKFAEVSARTDERYDVRWRTIPHGRALLGVFATP